MSEFRALLERVADGAEPAGDAFDRLAQARRRRHRNRRLGGAAVSILVATSGLAGAWVAFRGSETVRPDPVVERPETPGFHFLWPEQTRVEALDAQRRVDAGNDLWRLDPDEVATKFAREILGWEDPIVLLCRLGLSCLDPLPSDAARRYLYARAGPICRHRLSTLGLPPPCGPAALELRRPVRTGDRGVWSVAKVTTEGLHIGLRPGAEIPWGGTVRVEANLPPDTTVEAGSRYVDECGTAWGSDLYENPTGSFSVTVAPSGSPCSRIVGEAWKGLDARVPGRPASGFVFALVTDGSHYGQGGRGHEFGFDLFGSPGGHSLGTPFMAMAAVPVRFVPPPS